MTQKFGEVESEIQHYLATDPYSQRELQRILDIEDENNIEFKREEVFINGISVDVMVYASMKKEMFSLIECKATNIGVTEYVRGIGQTLQYEYFFEKNIKPKNNNNYNFYNKFQTLLIITSDFMKETSINVAKFKYPKTLKLVEINTNNLGLRVIDSTEINKIDKNTDEKTKAFNFYYFRDNRIFELFILLTELNIQSFKIKGTIHRKDLIDNSLNNIETINKNNWRNAFITLSSTGLIDSENRPTNLGTELAKLDFPEFAYEIYQSYLKDYIDYILKIMIKNDLFDIEASYTEIINIMKNDNNGVDILYLTQSGSRYLGSFLHIMRDDYGIVSFQPRNKKRKLNYNISELNKDTIIKNIKSKTTADTYLDNYFNQL